MWYPPCCSIRYSSFGLCVFLWHHLLQNTDEVKFHIPCLKSIITWTVALYNISLPGDIIVIASTLTEHSRIQTQHLWAVLRLLLPTRAHHCHCVIQGHWYPKVLKNNVHSWLLFVASVHRAERAFRAEVDHPCYVTYLRGIYRTYITGLSVLHAEPQQMAALCTLM